MSRDYTKNLIKSYKYWDVFVHENQGYLGRCYVWCKRLGVQDLTQATSPEWGELQSILIQLKRASTNIFKPDWFNFPFLGNNAPHLHVHFIPRYATPKDYLGFNFNDKLYGHNYRTDPSFSTPPLLLSKVKRSMVEELNKITIQL